MIPALIKQAMAIKMKSDKNPAIISDYELIYSCGLLCRILRLERESDVKQMRENIVKKGEKANLKKIEIERLFKMVKDFEPIGDAKNIKAVDELFKMGIECSDYD